MEKKLPDEQEKGKHNMKSEDSPSGMSLQKESEWKEDPLLIFADDYANAAYLVSEESHPLKEQDVAYQKLKDHVLQSIATAVSNRENEIADEVERMKVYLPQAHPDWSENYGRNDTINKVLQILKH